MSDEIATNCYLEYNNIINTDTINKLSVKNNEVLNFVKKCKDYEYSEQQNIFTFTGEYCRLVSKKQEIYYRYTYDPRWFLEYLHSSLCKYTDSEKEYLLKIIDFTPKERCCNCIAIVLYISSYKEKFKDDLYKYLNSMSTTLKITNEYLDNFVVRFYIHKNVFETIEYIIEKYENIITNADNKKVVEYQINRIIENFKFIILNRQSEIYVYFCDNLTLGIHKYRTIRFMPLLDNTVNVCIIREADGYVGITDCHNIKLFALESEHKILMLYDIGNSFKYKNHEYVKDINTTIYDKETRDIKNLYDFNITEKFMKNDFIKNRKDYLHYSLWLNLYENIFIKKGNFIVNSIPNYVDDDQKISFVDMLAGCIGIKLKLNNAFIGDRIIFLNKQINLLTKCHELMIKQHDKYFDIFVNKKNKLIHTNNDTEVKYNISMALDNKLNIYTNNILIEMEDSIHNNKYITKMLFLGYDEILLLLLYGFFTRVKYTKIYNEYDSENEEDNSVKEDNYIVDNQFDLNDISEKEKLLVLLTRKDLYLKAKEYDKVILDNINEIFDVDITGINFTNDVVKIDDLYNYKNYILDEHTDLSVRNIVAFISEKIFRKYRLKNSNSYVTLNIELVNVPFITDEIYNYIYTDEARGGNRFIEKYKKYIKKLK